MKSCLIIVPLVLAPSPAAAQAAPAAPASGPERRLSPQPIEAVLAEAAKKREASERQELPVGQAEPRQIHGEVGVSIGTGGHRGAFGTAVYPVGDDGAAAISFDFLDRGRRRYKR